MPTTVKPSRSSSKKKTVTKTPKPVAFMVRNADGSSISTNISGLSLPDGLGGEPDAIMVAESEVLAHAMAYNFGCVDGEYEVIALYAGASGKAVAA